MSLRLFVALPVPDIIAEAVLPLQRGIPGARWRPREALHITLRFVGEVAEDVARDLDEVLAEIAMPPFELSLEGAGSFGSTVADSLWLGVARNPTLDLLAGRCERLCRRLGLAPETRNFLPHLTMAYLSSAADPARVAAFVQDHATFRSVPWLADRFHLYSSWLGKGPSRYIIEAEYPLIG